MIVESRAIILSSRAYGDSSKLIHAFTRDFGRQAFIAKGARKAKNKFASSLEPMSLSKLYYYAKPGRSLHLLSNSEIEFNHSGLSRSLTHSACGLMMSELLNSAMPEGADYPHLFDRLTLYYNILNTIPENPFNFLVYFIAELADELGFRLMNNKGTHGGGIVFISLSDGTPRERSKTDELAFAMEQDNFIYLETILSSELENVNEIPVGKVNKEAITNFLQRYLSFHLEKKIQFNSFYLLN